MGIVFDIQRFCLHDGPGIRTCIFLKGCMMRCIWCHNPESFRLEPQLSYDDGRCIKCRVCEKECPGNFHSFNNDSHSVAFERCSACGRCTKVCPNEALTVIGREMSAVQVIDEVKKDISYYVASGGGVTFTGGEPTMQIEFLTELLMLCKEENLHTCLETNGMLTKTNLLKIITFVDLFLLDYKATGNLLHEKLTGLSSKPIFNTLAILEEYRKPIVLRCPIIPGINDSKLHFKRINELKQENKAIISVEIMPYHTYGNQKWDKIGKTYLLKEIPAASKAKKAAWETAVQARWAKSDKCVLHADSTESGDLGE